MGDYCKLTLPKSGGLTQMKKKTKFDDITENTQGLIDKSLLHDWEEDSELFHFVNCGR